MPKSESPKSFKLAIYLLKQKYKDFRKALKAGAKYDKYDFNEKMHADGGLIIGIQSSNEPNWVDFVQNAVTKKIPSLSNASNRAVLFFHIDNRVYAIPFGYGKYLIDEGAIEREFGLKTALNMINADKLISVDKANVGDMSVQTKTQTSRKSTPDVFNIDVLRDLLKGITGELKDSFLGQFGSLITGNEGLYLSPKIDVSGINDLLNAIHTHYLKVEYKDRFDWIDNIKQERDPAIIEELKNKLLLDLSNQEIEQIHIAPPIIISWEELEYICYTPKGEELTEFNIEDFYRIKEDVLNDLDWSKLLRQRVYLKYRGRDEPLAFSLLKFINYQVEYKSSYYVLNFGNWYRVESSYYDEIYNYCDKIPESTSSFIDCVKGSDEGVYNDHLAKSDANYILLDKDLVQSDKLHSKIEVCDVLNIATREFIHVKFRSSSSSLSHLFSQGKVSAVLLRKDKGFRKKVRTKLKANKKIVPLEDRDFNTNSYIITFAIIESKDRTFVNSLPFFSLVNFRLVAEELILMGYKVNVKKIRIL